MTVREICKQRLEADGYDGLCNPDLECGCLLPDLMPCGECGRDCQPGYKGPVNEDGVGEGVYLTREAAKAAKENNYDD